MMYMEWIAWFKDGNIMSEYNNEGVNITWEMILNYHSKISPIIRLGWLPIEAQKVEKINKLSEVLYVHRPLPSYFLEVRDGELPYISKRSILQYSFKTGQQGIIYFYILGTGGKKVLDKHKGEYFVEGTYMAIDQWGHVRLDTTSLVHIPVLPPQEGDKSRADLQDENKRK